MPPAITSEIVVAYTQCPRKAYLLLVSPDQGEPHEYVRILEQQQRENHARYLDCLQHKHTDVQPYPYNDTCLDMLNCPAYAASKDSDHLSQETADVTSMSHARRGVLHPAV